MTKKIYKYFGPDLSNVALSADGAVLKCSLPKDFNDPYELFLTVDFSSDASALACYQEAIGSIPQLPTTCFSNSPAVSPMWAHYGKNVSGFVLEIDEDELKEAFPESRLDDVRYQDEADDGLTDMLHRAHVIGKPRYTYFLQGGTFNAAYFTKASCWSYEVERRMIAAESEVRNAGELLLLDVPMNCITAIIAGSRADDKLAKDLAAHAGRFGCSFFRMQIGRTTISPYFLDTDDTTFTFDGERLIPAEHSCETCKEPCPQANPKCSWCQITDEQRYEAAIRNPYRMLDRVGRLDSYLESMNRITAGISRKRS